MTRSLLFLLAVSLSGQTTFSDFALDVKSHSTARIGWTTDAVIANWNLEWDTQATPPFANATSYRNDSSGPTWYVRLLHGGQPDLDLRPRRATAAGRATSSWSAERPADGRR